MRPLVGGVLAVALLTVSCDESSEKRSERIYQLQKGGTDNEAALREFLDDADANVRARALNVLVHLPVDDGAALARADLRDESGYVRSIACKLLGDLKDGAAVEDIGRLLREDPESWVRQRAAEALGRIGGPGAGVALEAGLDDPVQSVRKSAVESIRRVDPTRAVGKLSRIALTDVAWEIRVEALVALVASEDEVVESVLEQALEDPNEFVRTAAENGLRRLRTPSEAAAQPTAGDAEVGDRG